MSTPIKIKTGYDSLGRPVLTTQGPHRTAYEVFATLSNAKRAAKRLKANRGKLEAFHSAAAVRRISETK